jgi:aromatic ring-opening dioxygenase LigB subunit
MDAWFIMCIPVWNHTEAHVGKGGFIMAVLASFIVPHPPIILPEIGRGQVRRIQKTVDAFREVARRIEALRPDTIVLTSPHAILYADYFHISPGAGARGDFGEFGARDVSEEAQYDTEFVEELSAAAKEEGLPAGTRGERDRRLDHGTLIPLRFIHEQYRRFRLVRVGLSGLSAADHYRLGQCVRRTAEKLGRRVVFVASGDLSHKLTPNGPYGFAPRGRRFENRWRKPWRRATFCSFWSSGPTSARRPPSAGSNPFRSWRAPWTAWR